MLRRLFLIIAILVILIGGILYLVFRENIHQEVKKNITSSQIPPNNKLPNPASANCIKVGGKLVIQKLSDGSEYGLCDFGDNMSCEEWALFRGECPVGGIKTTGFDNIEQKYCAWLGGQTYAVPNATCKLPNGHTCSDIDLYNGKCS